MIVVFCWFSQVRNHKGRKTSKYAPEEGNRYDGIYKVTHTTAETVHYRACSCIDVISSTLLM